MTLAQHAGALTRPQWMRLLALAPEGTLRDLLQPLAQAVSYTFLRRPEAGLLMVEGKTGGTRFNLGEMLVTRVAPSARPIHLPKPVSPAGLSRAMPDMGQQTASRRAGSAG